MAARPVWCRCRRVTPTAKEKGRGGRRPGNQRRPLFEDSLCVVLVFICDLRSPIRSIGLFTAWPGLAYQRVGERTVAQTQPITKAFKVSFHSTDQSCSWQPNVGRRLDDSARRSQESNARCNTQPRSTRSTASLSPVPKPSIGMAMTSPHSSPDSYLRTALIQMQVDIALSQIVARCI